MSNPLLDPLHEAVAIFGVEDAESRQVLDLVTPEHLVAAVQRGQRRALTEYELGPRARAALTAWTSEMSARARGLRPLWNEADARERGSLGAHFAAGVKSDKVGLAIGQLFGPVGMLVGGAVDVLVASDKVEKEITQSFVNYIQAVANWCDYCENCAHSIAHADEQDAADARARALAGQEPAGLLGPVGAELDTVGGGRRRLMVVLIAIVGLVVVGGSIGGLAAYFSSSAPKPVASTAPMTTALPALPSSWVAKDGAQYRLEQDGSRIELVIADMGKGHLGPGEVEFVLIKPERGAETYRVSHTLRPLLPTKSMYDEAGYTSCLRTITSVEGSALVARVSPQKIEIEMAVLELPARAFKRSPRTGKIVACDGLGTAEAFRRTMQLVPNRSGD